MNHKAKLSRRALLRGSALAAGGVMLSACSGGSNQTNSQNGGGGEGGTAKGKGSHTEPLPTPDKLSEAPMLTEQVNAGKLPELSERLPENPYVVPHKWLTKGKYGGTLNTITSATDNGDVAEYMYGHSLLRWLNDGLNIGPGLVEEWDSNDDASVWTFYFRKGLKWSDGEPWTTADIMFWWEDMVQDEDHIAVVPDECKSGKGTPAKFTAQDDYTLVLEFDAPAPLTADRMANWVNGTRNVDDSWPAWMAPRHYAEKFHVKYNPEAGKEWADEGGPFEKNVNYTQAPGCPTMNGWMTETIKEQQYINFVRNPYYWAVSPEGDQLPYIDKIAMAAIKEFEVGKTKIQNGEFDYVHGPFYDTFLEDVQTLRKVEKDAGIELLFWDSGSGTGSMFFLNYDHKDPNFREVIRMPEFRQAISHAFNRKEVQKSLYFNTGELTTGTLSPKAIEYLVNDEGKQVYKDWRDAYVQYDPDKAKQLLDGIGVKDTDGDGFRELPNGDKLIITLDHAADTNTEHLAKNNLLQRDLEAVGLRAQANPVPPDTWGKQWEQGNYTAKTDWEVGDGPNHLVFPQWLVPIEPQRWAPLEGSYYNVVRGTDQEEKVKGTDPFERSPRNMEPEPGGPIEQIWKLYDQSKVEPDEMKRHQLVWDMIKIHIEYGPFFMGCAANTARVMVKKTDLKNVPYQENLALGGFVNPWIHPTPAVYDPETYFWENPDEHTT